LVAQCVGVGAEASSSFGNETSYTSEVVNISICPDLTRQRKRKKYYS